MNCRYRVTLAGIKGFFRVYYVNGNNTLYTFHKQLRADLEFPMDQPILFKGLDDKGAVVGRWALVDLGSGTVDQVRISDTVKLGVQSFVYFYDIASKKSVIVTLEGDADKEVLLPSLVESKGPVPLEFENGYVAFEDLPDDRRHLPGEKRSILDILGGDGDDDDDDDEEDEEDADDKPEEIYDESEEI